MILKQQHPIFKNIKDNGWLRKLSITKDTHNIPAPISHLCLLPYTVGCGKRDKVYCLTIISENRYYKLPHLP